MNDVANTALDGTSPESASVACDGELIAVVVTYRRPKWLQETLRVVHEQTFQPRVTVVVDNAPSEKSHRILEAAHQRQRVQYLPQDDNLGPAGGLAVGLERALSLAQLDDCWIVLLDDDDPPSRTDALERLWNFAHKMVEREPQTAGVGKAGARLVRSRGLLWRVPTIYNLGPYEVDYIGGGQLPFYRADAIREAGVFKPEMFFGFEELEFGVRMKEYGYRLYVDGTEIYRERQLLHDQNDYDELPAWRRYYSTRNLISVLRDLGSLTGALAVSVRSLAGSFLRVGRNPREIYGLTLTIRAIADGWLSRMGRTIDP